MPNRSGKPTAGAVVLRTLACLLLTASLAMLFFPWVSLRAERDGRSRITGGAGRIVPNFS